MKLLPPPACNFVIHTEPKYPVIETIRYMFWYERKGESIRHLLGSFDGNTMKDTAFYRKIKKIQTMLEYADVPYYLGHYNLHEEALAAARRLDQEQKRKRKHTKLMNAYEAKKLSIENSSDLFKADKLEELEEELKAALKKLSEMYLL